MIITAPTGLYKGILPTENSSGNVTYTISTQDPPRANITVLQLPIAEELATAPDEVHSEKDRREQFGELIFSLVQSSRNLIGASNAKTFEVGEILDFEVGIPTEDLVNVRSPDDIEIQHNTNMLNLENLGLTQEEIESLEEQSAVRQKELEAEFAQKQNELKDFDNEIRETQKTINENNKALRAVQTILGLPDGATSDDPIFQKLSGNDVDLNNKLADLITERNVTAQEVADIHKLVLKVSELVR